MEVDDEINLNEENSNNNNNINNNSKNNNITNNYTKDNITDDENSLFFFSNFEKDKRLTVSKQIKNLIPNLNIEVQVISFNIPFEYLLLIKEYCEHHNFIKPNPITMPLPYNDFSKCIKDKWDYNFIMKLNIKECLEFVNYLEEINCESLYSLCCARIGFYFRCENIKKIKADFNLPVTKFTNEEKEKIISENPWMKDIIRYDKNK